jgi:hypothetical protein
VGNAGNTALLVHEGKKAKNAFNPTSTENADFKIFLPVIRCLLTESKSHGSGIIVDNGRAAEPASSPGACADTTRQQW